MDTTDRIIGMNVGAVSMDTSRSLGIVMDIATERIKVRGRVYRSAIETFLHMRTRRELLLNVLMVRRWVHAPAN